MNIFAKLPKELINSILPYDGRIKYKDGIYTNIISKNDSRYDLLSKLKYPTMVKYTHLVDCFIQEHFEYIIDFNEQFHLSAFNLSIPPTKITYFFHTNLEIDNRYYIYYRE